MTRTLHRAALVLMMTSASAGCLRGPGARFAAHVAATAIITAAIISATAPPPPRVVYVPPPQPGYTWQPGYWSVQNGQWVWVEGGWVPQEPGYAWAPAHWEQMPDGRWRFVPGQWVPVS